MALMQRMLYAFVESELQKATNLKLCYGQASVSTDTITMRSSIEQ